MVMQEWYRRTSWSKKDRDEFWDRWSRSRTRFNKAQYLCIQGMTLCELNDHKLSNAGVDLLHKVIQDFQDEMQEVARAYHSLGSTFERQNHLEKAADAYRNAIDSYKKCKGSVSSDADIHFAYMVARHRIESSYPQAIEYLQYRFDADSKKSTVLPLGWFQIYTAASFIQTDLNLKNEACTNARKALEYAKLNNSGFRYHPTLGHVDRSDTVTKGVLDKLKSISSSG